MKYLSYVPFFLFVVISFIIGAVCYLWGFDKDHFKAGLKYLNKRLKFAEFMDRTF